MAQNWNGLERQKCLPYLEAVSTNAQARRSSWKRPEMNGTWKTGIAKMLAQEKNKLVSTKGAWSWTVTW